MNPRRNKGNHVNIRVLVVDDHEFFRKGVSSALIKAEGITIVSEANNVEAMAKCRFHLPDIVVLGINSSKSDGLEVVRFLRDEWPHIKILVMGDTDKPFFDALKLGVQGFLLKNANPDVLVHGLSLIAMENTVFPDSSLKNIFCSLQNVFDPEMRKNAKLTKREIEVLRLVGSGERNREIAKNLGVSESTIQFYVSKILKKLHCRNRHEATLYAIQYGQLSDDNHQNHSC